MPDSDRIHYFESGEHSVPSTIETLHVDVDALLQNTHLAGDANNNPNVQLEQSKLDIDNQVIARLTQKPPDKYKFRKSIGRGGMKMVLQVKDLDSTRDVAMAVLPDAGSRNRQDLLRFVQEARVTASLEHPNIVPVHDIGVDSTGAPYFTMKLLRGEHLGSILEKLTQGVPEYLEEYTLTRMLRIFLKICYAVAFAHSKGIIHLDLKPENIQIGDFGEVLVMDWGLAKIMDQKGNGQQKSSQSEPNDLEVFEDFSTTADGIMKGTPGYMSPEQASGKNSITDHRTDIYSLGAILYAMSTHLSPIESKNIREMTRDTISGNIIPPRKRAPELDIPTALEAVIMKAMSLNPNDRYASVKELRSEVYAFIGGYATKAEQATYFKKTLLWFKRHKIIFSSIFLVLFVLLLVLLYAIQEHMRQKAPWTCVYEQNFTKQGTTLEDLSFTNNTITKEVAPWSITKDGLSMVFGEWLWIDKKFSGNTKLEVVYQPGDVPDAIEVCLNSRKEPLKQWWYVPTGFSFQFGGYSGTRDVIFRNMDALEPESITMTESKVRPNEINTVSFIINDSQLEVQLGTGASKPYLTAVDLFPPSGKGMNQIGLRSFSKSAKLISIRAYRLAPPEKASPLIAGDVLLEEQMYGKAIERYLTVADSYTQLPLADSALTKAYMTIVSKLQPSEQRTKLMTEVKKRIAEKTSFRYKEQILEMDALALWKDGEYKRAMTIIHELLKLNPNSSVMVRILQIPHQALPKGILPDFLAAVAATRNIKYLDVSNYGLSTLKPLKELQLRFLNCSDNHLESLEGVQEMPLESLLCYGNQISDLTPLNGKKIKNLSCKSNRIADLSPLAKMPLRDLNIAYNQVESLTPLSENTGLESLVCRSNQISDLSPLSKQPLWKLDAGDNPISDLAPLRSAGLNTLILDHTNIQDLSPLSGMPLQLLELHNCDQITDISPIFSLSLLERLSLPPNSTQLEPLKKMESIKFLSKRSIAPFASEPETSEDFWKKEP